MTFQLSARSNRWQSLGLSTTLSQPPGNRQALIVVPFSDESLTYITNALSPAKVNSIQLNEEERSAYVIVPDGQLSLAIGKGGQNVRLAARLTEWKIDIRSETQAAAEGKVAQAKS